MFRYCISLVFLHSRCPRCDFALGHYSRVLWSFFQGSRVVHVAIFRLDTAVPHFLPPVLFLATGETSHHLCPFSDHLWWLRLIFLFWLFQVTLNTCIGYHIPRAAWNKAPKIEYDLSNPRGFWPCKLWSGNSLLYPLDGSNIYLIIFLS